MNNKEIAALAEMRGLQTVVASMLGAAFMGSDDRAKEIARFTESVEMSIAASTLEKLPEAKREIFRTAWRQCAMTLIAGATTFRARPRPETSDPHQ